MSRKRTRDLAFKCVYQMSMGQSAEYVINACFANNEVNDESKATIETNVKGISDNLEMLDGLIKENLKKWSMSRIPKIDLAILRLAIYEIKFDEGVPYKVAVNEAVELAKTYSTEESPSFINGVLAKITE
ncbi:MAG: transcription antitermination factor NusB [Clostridia bacterium]